MVTKKEKPFNLTDFNKGFKPKKLRVGDRVGYYRTPYRESQLIAEGEIVHIYWQEDYNCFADVLFDGKKTPNGVVLYTGKVYRGKSKP